MYVSERGVPSFCVWGWRVRPDVGLGGLPLDQNLSLFGQSWVGPNWDTQKGDFSRKWYADYVRSWLKWWKKFENFFTPSPARSPTLARWVNCWVFECHRWLQKWWAGLRALHTTRKLLPLPTSAFPAQKRSVPCFLNIWMCWKYGFLVPISLFHSL
jgi:hypothetical protein